MEAYRCMGCMHINPSGLEVCPHCGYVRGTGREQPGDLPPGAVLNERYCLGRALAHAPDGISYIAFDMLTERRVAIHEFLPNGLATRDASGQNIVPYAGEAGLLFEEARDQFLVNGMGTQQLGEAPGLGVVYDAWSQFGTAYVATELLEGFTLEQYRDRRGGRLSPQEAQSLLQPVLEGVQLLHGAGLLHGDITPGNMIVTETGQVKLAPLGMARCLVTLEAGSKEAHSHGYRALECCQAASDLGPWTDVYGAGATFYALITGQAPPNAWLRKNKDPLEPPSKCGVLLPASMEKALLHALAVPARKRIHSMDVFATQLCGADASAKGHGLARAPKVAILAGACAVALVLILSLAGVFSRGEPDEAPGGDQLVLLPKVTGKDKEEAQRAIEALGLLVQFRSEPSDLAEKGKVLRQLPEAGQQLYAGAVVGLVIGAGADEIHAEPTILSSFIGWPYDEAVSELEKMGLTVIKEEKYSKKQSNYIIDQSVPEGTEITEGLQVVLTVSRGPKPKEDTSIVEDIQFLPPPSPTPSPTYSGTGEHSSSGGGSSSGTGQVNPLPQGTPSAEPNEEPQGGGPGGTDDPAVSSPSNV